VPPKGTLCLTVGPGFAGSGAGGEGIWMESSESVMGWASEKDLF
jgi:hypothetical protein